MLTGGIMAYPTLSAYLASPDTESLEFSVTLAPPPTPLATLPDQVALEPTPVPVVLEPDPTSTAPRPLSCRRQNS